MLEFAQQNQAKAVAQSVSLPAPEPAGEQVA
jgi:hypothetical protein